MWQLRLNSVKEPLVHLIHKKEGGGRSHAHFYPPIFFSLLLVLIIFLCYTYFLHEKGNTYNQDRRTHVVSLLTLKCKGRNKSQVSVTVYQVTNQGQNAVISLSCVCMYVCYASTSCQAGSKKTSHKKRERERERNS